MTKRLTARNIIENYRAGDHSPDEDKEGFWETKLEDAKFRGSQRSSLYESIQTEGQKKPILLNQKTMEIVDGHHRLAALHHMNPDQFVKYRHIG